MANKGDSSTWYRKYRSRDFSELVGQPHITASLENALRFKRISHAYLFAGPRGTGKTSTARILASRVNGIEYGQVINHLDVIEIDAASNRRIEEIRQLREKVHSAPTSAKYKVYIIDEAHMLTTEAANALLKTLEEPPAHVIFILATTEPHKIPQTIISRTQRFNFRPLPEAIITKQLKQIVKQERIKIDDSAIDLIAFSANGSMRDGISLLDQLSNLKPKQKITNEDVARHLGIADNSYVDTVLVSLAKGELKQLIGSLDKLNKSGINPQQFSQQLAKRIQQIIRVKEKLQSADKALSSLVKQYSKQHLSAVYKLIISLGSSTTIEWHSIEALLIDLALTLNKVDKVKNNGNKTEKKLQTNISKATAKKSEKPQDKTTLDQDLWIKILSHVKQHHNSIFALLNAAEPEFHPQKLKLYLRFAFHKKQLDNAKNKSLLTKAINNFYKSPIEIEVIHKPSVSKADNSELAIDTDVDNVLQILGGEVINDNT